MQNYGDFCHLTVSKIPLNYIYEFYKALNITV